MVDLSGDVTLQTADDLHLREPLFGPPLDVGAGARVLAVCRKPRRLFERDRLITVRYAAVDVLDPARLTRLAT